MIVFLLVILAFAVYVMKPEERARAVRAGLALLGHAKDAAVTGPPGCETFVEALRERTPWPVVTPALVALNTAIFICMLFSPGALSDPETLVAWGGNYGPRTTNGEWWRLTTAMFVHWGMLHLFATVAGLVAAGLILERLVGPFAFAVVYVAAGVLSSVVSLSAYPMAVGVGASGAVFGIYGLLLASAISGMLHQSSLTIPLAAMKTLAPGAAIFILYNATSTAMAGVAETTGFVVGVVCGLVLVRDVSEEKPAARRVAVAMAATAVIAVASAVPLRGVADVRPEITRVIEVEERTATIYQAALDLYKLGRMTPEELAKVIDRKVVPELRALRARLKTFDGVPKEHQPLVTNADEYLQLRDESWRLRAGALRKPTMSAIKLALRQADRTEVASLEVLDRIKPARQK
ncbi:MAG: rhomboid family intramembrane serine protease [Acidobacteria bacterium]|nr:rhomboid family intramembrane serine protease [Acidobacteriota bacterium]MCA1651447.1 rhomboid family intramembrane serine protease [Acidobacteriota bacterium]